MSMSAKGFLILITILGTTLTVLILAAVAATTTFSNSAFAQGGREKFVANLSVSQVVPPIDSNATGSAEFEPTTEGTNISYTVNVTDINAVKGAHIHIGEVGQNGPIVVTLFEPETPTGQQSGLLSKGNITSDSLKGPMAGKQLSDLIDVMKNEGAYVNVHTQQNPDGEIRGQIEPAPGQEEEES
jgi:hypothetical protein